MLQDTPQDQWHKICLAYDNMCQLVKLKASKIPLPLPEPYDKMWSKITKVVDGLHISNHVEDFCKEELHPNKIGEVHPHLKETKNTQSAEQTFVWLARYKKIVASMPKTHHLFYVHRLVVRRNKYTATCYKEGRKPQLPSVRNGKTV